jgi:hypothetical protein
MFISLSIYCNHSTSLAFEIFYARKVDLFDNIKEVVFSQLFPCLRSMPLISPWDTRCVGTLFVFSASILKQICLWSEDDFSSDAEFSTVRKERIERDLIPPPYSILRACLLPYSLYLLFLVYYRIKRVGCPMFEHFFKPHLKIVEEKLAISVN